jgi:hypothetical protein
VDFIFVSQHIRINAAATAAASVIRIAFADVFR